MHYAWGCLVFVYAAPIYLTGKFLGFTWGLFAHGWGSGVGQVFNALKR